MSAEVKHLQQQRDARGQNIADILHCLQGWTTVVYGSLEG